MYSFAAPHARLLRRQQRPDAKSELHDAAPGVRGLPARPRRRLRLGRRVLAGRRAPTSWPRWSARSRAACATPSAYAKALTAADAPREDARLVDFDVIFLRNNPNAGGEEGDRFNPALDFGRRLKQLGVLVRQRSRRPVAGRLEDVPGRLSGRAAPEDPDHPLDRAGAGVPARARRARDHQAAGRVRRPERLLRRARPDARTCRR